MADYRRYYVPGGSVFITVVTVTEHRRPILCTPLGRAALRAAIHETRARWPFMLDAIVLLPDHLHAILTLPPGDADYSKRLGFMKLRFTQRWLEEGGDERPPGPSRQRHRRRGIWQRRFWEHTLRDERDYFNHLNYLHYNPVKHGYVACPREWPYSSFHRWLQEGAYTPGWGCDDLPELDDLAETVGE